MPGESTLDSVSLDPSRFQLLVHGSALASEFQVPVCTLFWRSAPRTVADQRGEFRFIQIWKRNMSSCDIYRNLRLVLPRFDVNFLQTSLGLCFQSFGFYDKPFHRRVYPRGFDLLGRSRGSISWACFRQGFVGGSGEFFHILCRSECKNLIGFPVGFL